jgi:hypothetical protein
MVVWEKYLVHMHMHMHVQQQAAGLGRLYDDDPSPSVLVPWSSCFGDAGLAARLSCTGADCPITNMSRCYL